MVEIVHCNQTFVDNSNDSIRLAQNNAHARTMFQTFMPQQEMQSAFEWQSYSGNTRNECRFTMTSFLIVYARWCKVHYKTK